MQSDLRFADTLYVYFHLSWQQGHGHATRTNKSQVLRKLLMDLCFAATHRMICAFCSCWQGSAGKSVIHQCCCLAACKQALLHHFLEIFCQTFGAYCKLAWQAQRISRSRPQRAQSWGGWTSPEPLPCTWQPYMGMLMQQKCCSRLRPCPTWPTGKHYPLCLLNIVLCYVHDSGQWHAGGMPTALHIQNLGGIEPWSHAFRVMDMHVKSGLWF